MTLSDFLFRACRKIISFFLEKDGPARKAVELIGSPLTKKPSLWSYMSRTEAL